VTLAYYTGWRINSELLALQWHQIDRAAGVLRLEPNTTKNREGRTFKYAEIEELRASIEGLWGRHQALERRGILTPLVFCRLKGQPVLTFHKRWKTACAAAGCPGRIPHDFRRTAVRNLNRAGVPETVAMKISGHKTRSVFDRYDITSEEDLAEASRKLQALSGTITGTIGRMDADALREGLSNSVVMKKLDGGEGRNRTVDTTIFSRMLYQLSYLATPAIACSAGADACAEMRPPIIASACGAQQRRAGTTEGRGRRARTDPKPTMP
jgi:hypothetical protein